MKNSEVIKFIKDQHIEFVNFRFIDLPGIWQHVTFPSYKVKEEIFRTGLGFDGSSIRGFQSIDKSDMLLIPDANTAFVDPFMKHKTLVLICTVHEPDEGRAAYVKDPRYIASKAEAFLKTTSFADTAYFGPEPEFYVFDSVAYDQGTNEGYYYVDAEDGQWNSGKMDDVKGNQGYKVRYKGGYFPVPPTDAHQDLRSEMVRILSAAGLKIEMHHHEVGTAGQAEIGLLYDTLVQQADNILKHKYIIRNVAHAHGKTATFMPKPLFGDNGSGMHTHMSLWNKGKNIFYDANGYAQLSETAIHFIGGILHHAPSLLAIVSPTTNSYRRLVPGFEAPVSLVYSSRNRSAAIRIPMYEHSVAAKRMEFRCPDPSCNPYLAFSAMLMAGIDGIENKIEPPAPLEKDLYTLTKAELGKIKRVPATLEQSLDALEKDNAYLQKGDVFPKEFIETWLEYKWEQEVNVLRQMPHPHEFALYYDI